MACFSNTRTNGYDSNSATWTDLIEVTNVYIPGGGTQTAAVALSGLNAFSSADTTAEFRALVDGTADPDFQASFNVNNSRSALALVGCVSVPGNQPAGVMVQVKKGGGDGPVCISGPMTLVIIT